MYQPKSKPIFSLMTVILAFILATAVADDEPVALRPADDYLELMVVEALAEDPVVESYEIVVLANEAEVTLYGSIDSEEDRQRAKEVAAGVEGVTEVHNEIEVVDPAYTVDKEDRAIEADFWKSARQRVETMPSGLEIRVLEGEVVLSGRVDSRAQRQALVEVAFDAGAVLVKPELEIGSADKTRID